MTKLFLQQELRLASRVNSFSLMALILLVTIHLIAYQSYMIRMDIVLLNVIVATETPSPHMI